VDGVDNFAGTLGECGTGLCIGRSSRIFLVQATVKQVIVVRWIAQVFENLF
jgi:hypothetical protein